MAISLSGSLEITGSLTVTGGINMSGSIASSSYASNAELLDGRDSLTFANTGSNSFVGSQNINGAVAITGSLTTTGAITAQTINVQQVTSSIVYSSGSNVFGNSLSNTQSMTGSVGITGSLSVNGPLTGTSATFTDGSQGLIIRPYTGVAGWGAIYPVGFTPSDTNYALIAKGTNTVLNASTSVTLAVGDSGKLTATATGVSINQALSGTSATFSGTITSGTGSGNSLSSGSVDVGKDIGIAATQGIVWNNSRAMVFNTSDLTLTRSLIGTSATFSGNVTANNGSVFVAYSSAGTVLTVMQSDNTAGYLGTNSSHPLILRTDSTERMRITSGGNVLIGTTSDNGAKLQVSGNTFISGFTSNQLGNHGEKFISLSGPNSAHSFDVATQFPSLAISGNVLGVTMFITIFGSGGSVETCIATIARNSAGTWASYGLTASSSTVSLLQSVTGSGTTITINTNAGSYVGVKVTAATQ